MNFKIFGISMVTLFWAAILLWLGFKFGAKIPLINRL